MKLKIVKDNKPSLRKKSVPVELPLSEYDRNLILAMNDYLIKSQDDEYAEKHHIKSGVGLAAPQVGTNKRMFVVYFFDGEKYVNHALVNPRIVETSAKYCALEGGEGCLSVDDEHPGLSHRHFKIKVEAFDAIKNENVVINATGFEAIVIQHEYDHLDGILFYDRIDPFNPLMKKPGEILL